MIASAVAATRAKVEALTLPTGYLPAEFTLAELQGICEGLLGRHLDKSSFRRKLDDRALVQPVEGKMMSGGAHRPAQVYRHTKGLLGTRGDLAGCLFLMFIKAVGSVPCMLVHHASLHSQPCRQTGPYPDILHECGSGCYRFDSMGLLAAGRRRWGH